MDSILHKIMKRIWCYFLLSMLTFAGMTNFAVQFAIYPVIFVSPTVYRIMTTFVQLLSTPGFLCVPFSWANCRLYANGLDRLQEATGQDQLILTNHSGRVDWLFGLYIGNFYGQRIGFITEAFLMWLPFVGWQRYLVEDMFVFRSFKKDKDRLLKNIADFKESGVKRWVYLCPEGHIADFNALDKQYIKDCGEFCKENGLEPFKMVLTPRYKGMQIFTKLCPKNDKGESIVRQGTLTYVQNGERLVKPLDNPNRIIPDLWNAVNGEIECYVHCHSFILSTEASEMKKQLLEDYSFQDKSLYEFYKTGRYPEAHPEMKREESSQMWQPLAMKGKPFLSLEEMDRRTGADTKNLPKRNAQTDFQEIPKNHLKMNASFFGHWALVIWVFQLFGIRDYLFPSFCILYIALASSHILGEVLANGQSRESLPFEGAFKAIMFRFYGVEGGDQQETKPTETTRLK